MTKIVKAMLSGIFSKSYELGDVDDSYFIKIIRAGIEKAEEVEHGIFSELFEHAIEEYTKVWMRDAEEENEFDEQEEREEARETFLEYFYEDEL